MSGTDEPISILRSDGRLCTNRIFRFGLLEGIRTDGWNPKGSTRKHGNKKAISGNNMEG